MHKPDASPHQQKQQALQALHEAEQAGDLPALAQARLSLGLLLCKDQPTEQGIAVLQQSHDAFVQLGDSERAAQLAGLIQQYDLATRGCCP